MFIDAIVKSISPKILTLIVICCLTYIGIIATIAVFRGQPVDLWVLKIGNNKIQQADQFIYDNSKNSAKKDLILMSIEFESQLDGLKHEINELNKQIQTETNLRLSKERRINELERNLKSVRESNFKVLKRELISIKFRLGKDEIELEELQKQYEVFSKKYYSNIAGCEKGESFYGQECKKAGELQGSIEGIKQRIDYLMQSINNNNKLYNSIIDKIE